MVNLNKSKRLVIIMALSLFAGLFFIQKTNLMTSDLGRHLKNGEIILASRQPVTTNLYSYTHPNYPFIAHHWGFGILAFSIYKLGGFNGLTIFNAVVFFLTIILILNYSSKRVGLTYTLLGFFLTLPLLTYRTEIRPETISALFIILTLLILTNTMRLPYKITLIFLLQMFWVNIHVFFVFGLLLSVTYLLTQLANRNYGGARLTSIILMVQTIASFVNPYGLKGALYPLHIFTDYGYRIVENQTPFLLLKVIPSPIYYYLLAIGAAAILSIVFSIKSSIKNDLLITLVSIVFLVGSLKMVRLIPYFGIFALLSLSYCLYILNLKYGDFLKRLLNKPLILISQGGVGFIVAFVLISSNLYNPFTNFGVGLMPGISKSADFFKENNLQGPIFNNYDAGGYLIFYLYPGQKVFVDNRPEAYPSSFFKTEYVSMQENEAVWEKLNDRYNFNVIYFYRHDYTPWAQPFLISRLKDPTWVPVYVDDYALILVKLNQQNADLISKNPFFNSIDLRNNL